MKYQITNLFVKKIKTDKKTKRWWHEQIFNSISIFELNSF